MKPSVGRATGQSMRSSPQRAAEPVDVQRLVDELAVAHAHDLIDAVGELIAAILDVHARFAVIDIASIDVGITRHALTLLGSRSRPRRRALVRGAAMQAERLQLAMQRRALHADEGRGARDVAAEARHLGQQILALEDLARVAQRQLHDLAALLPAQHRGRVLADVVGQRVGADRPAAGRRQDQQPLDDVAQLAHVARPVVALQGRQRVLADRPRRQAGGVGDALQQVVGDFGDVLAALAERRHAQAPRHSAGGKAPRGKRRTRSRPAGRAPSRRARGHRPRPWWCRRRA